jgi:superoxide dismutase, Fe-Mn family
MHTLDRRQLLKAAGAGAAALALAPWTARADADKAPFDLPKLPYAYDALEPHIDAQTMQIHHDRHHKAYVDNLNKEIAKHPSLQGKSIEAILRHIDTVPKESRQAIINNGGGHANHTLFWQVMSKNGGKASGALSKAIDEAFGGLEKFQQTMSQAGATRFGSGWAWLVLEKGKLRVLSTANQDSPLMAGQTPILGLDVWEHAYYLKYQNRRPDYIKAWWNVVNWADVSERYHAALKHA